MKIFGIELKLPRFLQNEKRRALRARIFEDVYVDFQTRNSPNPLRGTGEGRDLSAHGIQFFCDKRFSVGTPIDLVLRFSPGILPVEKLWVQAQVVRCHKGFREKQCRVACDFENVDEQTKKHIEVFVSFLKQREEKYLFFRYGKPDE